MRTTLILSCLIVFTTFLPTSTAAAADKELEKMQGDWVTKVQTEDGEKTAKMSVDGKKIRFDTVDGQEWYEGTFEFDAAAKPNRISVLIKDCPFEQFKNKTSEGIYRLQDKTWTIAATAPGAPEGPSGFDDEKARTLVFKRAK